MESKDAYNEDYEGILAKALERIRELKEANTSLSSELALARGQATSHQVDRHMVEHLEKKNHELSSELEAIRKKLQALREVVTKSVSDLKQEAQHLNKKLEATCTVLDLYELLYDVESPFTMMRKDYDTAEAPYDGANQVVVPIEKRLRVISADRQPEGSRPFRFEPEERPEGKVSEASTPTKDAAPISDRASCHDDLQGSGALHTGADAREAGSLPLEVESSRMPLDRTALPELDFEPQGEEGLELAGPVNRIEIIASPFTRFDTINKFTGAVRSLPGVTDAKVRHFQNGTLRMLVEYENVVPFVNRLRDIASFRLRIEASSDRRVVATLEPQDSNVLVAGSVV